MCMTYHLQELVTAGKESLINSNYHRHNPPPPQLPWRSLRPTHPHSILQFQILILLYIFHHAKQAPALTSQCGMLIFLEVLEVLEQYRLIQSETITMPLHVSFQSPLIKENCNMGITMQGRRDQYPEARYEHNSTGCDQGGGLNNGYGCLHLL